MVLQCSSAASQITMFTPAGLWVAAELLSWTRMVCDGTCRKHTNNTTQHAAAVVVCCRLLELYGVDMYSCRSSE
jgi:hypothetical protein